MWLKLDNIPGTLHEDRCTFVSLVFIMATGCVVCGIQAEAEKHFCFKHNMESQLSLNMLNRTQQSRLLLK